MGSITLTSSGVVISDPLDAVVLGGDGRVEHQRVAFLDVLQHTEESVTMGRYADIAYRARQRRVLDPPGGEVEHGVRGAVVDRAPRG